jgi:hypothetical protein
MRAALSVHGMALSARRQGMSASQFRKAVNRMAATNEMQAAGIGAEG